MLFFVHSLACVIGAAVVDMSWAFYLRRANSGLAGEAAFWAVVLLGLGMFLTMSWYGDHRYIPFTLIGAGLGTYFTVKHDHRKKSLEHEMNRDICPRVMNNMTCSRDEGHTGPCAMDYPDNRCSRCFTPLDTSSAGEGWTAGYYVAAGWPEFAYFGEKYICDDCMWSDPRYIAVYGDMTHVGGSTDGGLART